MGIELLEARYRFRRLLVLVPFLANFRHEQSAELDELLKVYALFRSSISESEPTVVEMVVTRSACRNAAVTLEIDLYFGWELAEIVAFRDAHVTEVAYASGAIRPDRGVHQRLQRRFDTWLDALETGKCLVQRA